MAMKPCLVCGALTREGSWCRAHTPKRWGTRPRTWGGEPATGSTAAWRKLRELVLTRDGRQCVAPVVGGRCPITTKLAVHHLRPRDEGGPDTAANLVTVCPEHHRLLEASNGRTSSPVPRPTTARAQPARASSSPSQPAGVGRKPTMGVERRVLDLG